MDGASKVGLAKAGWRLEHCSMSGSFIHVVCKNVSSSKDQIVQSGERHKIFDERSLVVRPLAQADGSHLGERTDRLGQSAEHRLDSSDHRGVNHGSQVGHTHF
jgi:hypothetical protein